jgi:hypothetical protein
MQRVAMNTSTKSLQLLSLLIADFCNKICQEATYAMQQIVNLFDHLIGDSKQRRRHGEAEHPGCLGIDHQIELRRLHDR